VLFVALAFVVSFIAEIAAIQFVAWMLGGRGTYTELSFLVAVYGVPVDVVGSLATSAIGPSVAVLPIACLIPLYSFALRFASIRAVHRLSNAASLVALIPGMVVSFCTTATLYLATYPWPEQFRELAA
jgi:hypothetical protein